MTNVFFESQQQRLARLVSPSELPPNPVKRHKSSEHQLLPTALVQGTTIAPPAKRSDSVQAASLRLPKLPSDLRLKQFLKRKKIITGLTPRIGRKVAPMYSVDPSENMPPIEKSTGTQSSTSKGFKSKDQPDALTSDFIQKVNVRVQHLHRVRASCSQSPEHTLEEKEETPRRSLEPEAERPQTLEERLAIESSHVPTTRLPIDAVEDLNSSGILMARKMKITTQIRASANTISEMPESQAPLHLPPKPFIKKRRPKQTTVSLEVKPTPEQSALICACLYTELSQALLRSNGMTPSISESSYKFYLGPGNNSQLLAFLMKRRWFWSRVETWQQADFIWTQNRHNSIVEQLERTVEPLTSQAESPFEAAPPRKKGLKLLMEAERGKSGIALITSSPSYTTLATLSLTSPICVYNRIERNYQLTTKKRLFLNMQAFYQSRNEDVFSALPLTFLMQEGKNDPEFERFTKYFAEIEAEKAERSEKGRVVLNWWIIKPGENTNCGHGIHVSSDLEEIRGLVSSVTTSAGRKRTFIVQKYIERPLLVNKRKFDIRCYGLLTCFNGHVQGYFYHDGYLRTSSKEFTLKNISNRFIHLTNDAVQKKSEDYGRFESGNKLSYPEFQKYLEANFPEQVNFWRDIWPRIKQLMTDSFQAVSRHVDPHRRKHTFEVLGYDFMIDEKFKVWLIEVNTNPCLSLSSTYLARLIPTMLDNAFRIAVDPYFPEPTSKKHQGEWASQAYENKFELVFSSQQDLQPDPALSAQISEAEEDSEAEAEEAN